MGAHIGLMLDGDINSLPLAYAEPPFVLNDGVVRYAWVDYDAASTTLEVFVSELATKPFSPLFSYAGLSLSSTLGPSVYAGFSASAGERFNDHEVLGQAWVGTSPPLRCP
jgi:hypothetical protein